MTNGKPKEWDEQSFQEALVRVEREGIIDAQGVCVSAEQLQRLLEAAPRSRPCPRRADLKLVNLSGTRFTGIADFSEVAFTDSAYFMGATFTEEARFQNATFSQSVNFQNAIFTQEAYFGRAAFKRSTSFIGTTFTQNADFDGAVFTDVADFNNASFVRDAAFKGATFTSTYFYMATFSQSVHFSRATFAENLSISQATFARDVDFGGAVISGDIDLKAANFVQARELGSMQVDKRCDLSQAVFQYPVVIRLDAGEVLLHRTTFERGTDIFLRRAGISLDEADFAAPSLLTEITPVPQDILSTEKRPLDEADKRPRRSLDSVDPPPPRVVSMRRAKVSQLTISGLDFSVCRFAGAHGLDRLRVERSRFAQPPAQRRRFSPRRWTRRQTIAEEHHWRRHAGKAADGWYGEHSHRRFPQPRSPGQVFSSAQHHRWY